MTNGVRQIVRFNWPFYVASTTGILLAIVAARALTIDPAVRTSLYASIGLALFWTVGSLGASWIVYDHSPLMQWTWIPRALGTRPRAWVNIHAGFDASTAILRELFESRGRAFDIFDPAVMTEGSIARARHVDPGVGRSESADFRHLPAATASVDAAFLLFSAHELRAHPARLALFHEVHRILTPEGSVVVVEHLRDWANFAAFGPGFLHFHSRRAWMSCFNQARFVVDTEFAITPFVRVFVLRSLRS